MIHIILLLAGLCLGLMQSLNGQLAIYLEIFEVSFLVHIIGAIVLILCMKLTTKEKIHLTGLPLYLYSVGFFGVSLVAISSFCTSHIGATLTMSLSVLGQLVVSAMIDHFGWFHKERVEFKLKRFPAYLFIVIGLVLMIGW
ncbi:MAG: DMT family transporter [Erysipelotrichaceae bacterium]|nr:DMT family transporter [Erysipelotrichaceae bacterium]